MKKENNFPPMLDPKAIVEDEWEEHVLFIHDSLERL